MRLKGLLKNFLFIISGTCKIFILLGFVTISVLSNPSADFLQQTSWTTVEGLPQNSIAAVVQTRDGYIWLGTFGGLVRFDGVKFTIFNTLNVPALTSQRIVSLYEDRHGILWIGTENGQILRYMNGQFFPFDRKQVSNITTTTFCLFVDSQGFLWTNDTQKTVIRYAFDENGFTRKDVFSFPSPDNEAFSMLGIAEDAGGDIWFYTHHAILRYQNGEFKKFTLENDFPFIKNLAFEPRNVFLFGIKADKNGVIWAATINGTARFDGKKFVRDVPDNTPNVAQRSLLVENSDGELSALVNNRIARRENGKWAEIGTLKENSFNMRKIIKDAEGNFWLGTYGDGLIRFKTPIIKYFGENLGVTKNAASSILEDRNGNIWATSYDLLKFENGRFISAHKSVGGVAFTALYEKKEGEILAGTWDGLISYRDGKFTDRSSEFISLLGVKSFYVNAIFEDRSGTEWFGVTQGNGLIRKKNDEIRLFTEKDGLKSDRIQTIFEDRRGAIWLGTYGGLIRFENDVFTNYTTAEGLTDNNVRALYEDQNGALWIGTYGGGLNRLKDGKMTHVTMQDGLFDDVVSRIIVDEKDNFWMLGNRGIFVVSRTELDEVADGTRKTVNSRSFGTGDGLEIAEGTGGSPAGWRTRGGDFWFPMVHGYIRITPPPPTDFSPPTFIEEVLSEKNLLDLHHPIEIKPGEENLEIRYTALGFTKPEQLQFKYQMKGLSDEWTNVGTRRTAYFSYLPSGEYEFTVIASNSDGVWNAQGKSIKIKVLPPFYRTWWFNVLAVLVFCLIVFGIFYLRVSRLKLEKRKQEEFSRRLIELQEHERKRIAGELHDSLSQNLVIIRNRAMLSLTSPDDTENAFEQMEEIAEAATHSLSEVREIAHNLRPFQIDRLGLTKAIEGLVRKINSSKIRVEAVLDDIDGLLSVEKEINLYRIIQECLNNIVKHSEASEADVKIKKTAKIIKVEIEDNGKGFDIASKNVQNAENKAGFGITSITERARILGCSPVFISAPAKGTKVSLQIFLAETRTK